MARRAARRPRRAPASDPGVSIGLEMTLDEIGRRTCAGSGNGSSRVTLSRKYARRSPRPASAETG